VSALLQEAAQHGVHYFLPPTASAHYPDGRLMIWNHRDPEGQRIVDEMRARRDEVTAFLREHRPVPLVISKAEEQYRRNVLYEPDDDLPLSELPFSTMRAIISQIVHDVLDAERASAAWEQSAMSSSPPKPAPTSRKGWVEL